MALMLEKLGARSGADLSEYVSSAVPCPVAWLDPPVSHLLPRGLCRPNLLGPAQSVL